MDAVPKEAEIQFLKARLAEAESLAAEKERLDLEYRASRKRFQTVFEQSSLGMKIINADLRIVMVNRSLTKILGYSEEELLGANIVDLSHPDFKSAWEHLREQLWSNSRQSFSIDACLIRKDRSSLWCHLNSITFEDHGETLGYTVIEDISERKRLEQLEKDMQEQRLLLQQQAEVVKATLLTQEKERERIAEGLHNSLGQLLFAAQIELNQVSFTAQSEKDRAALKKAADLLYSSIRECRQISHQLMPVILHDYGLKAAIEGICRDMPGVVAFSSHIQLLTPKNDRSFEIVVYRLIQELVLNISKHSEATRGLISITENTREVVITVEDNGIGFDREKVKGEGIGLASVRNNVNLLNGSFSLKSAPGEGTKITVSLPSPGEYGLT